VWYQGATEQTLAGLDRRVEIGAEDHNLPPLAIDAVPQKPAGHKNKYGKDYDPAMWPAVY
jgi:hypothetical protein